MSLPPGFLKSSRRPFSITLRQPSNGLTSKCTTIRIDEGVDFSSEPRRHGRQWNDDMCTPVVGGDPWEMTEEMPPYLWWPRQKIGRRPVWVCGWRNRREDDELYRKLWHVEADWSTPLSSTGTCGQDRVSQRSENCPVLQGVDDHDV